MKHRVSFLRYLIIAMLTVFCAAFALTACGGDKPKTEQVAVKWQVGEHATVAVENYEGLPESVDKGSTLVFTVTCDGGYVVDTVQRDGGRDVNLTNGKYTVSSIVSDTTITITTKKEIKSLNVTASGELSYVVGDTVDKSTLTVKAVYTDNSEETIAADNYRIRYQGSTTASAFALGNDYFTVVYDNVESEHIALKEKVSAVITVDPWGATVLEDYFTELEKNSKITVTKLQEGNQFTISFNEPLESDLSLPGALYLIKTNGDAADFRFKGWDNPFVISRGEGDAAQDTPSDIIPKETAACGTITAGWNAQLVDATSIKYVKEGETVYLELKGNYHAATEVYFWFYEGNRKVGYDGSATKSAQGTKGGAFTLKFDVTPLSTAKASDGGNYLDSWFDLKIRGMVGGLLEEQEFDLNAAEVEIDTEQALESGGFTYKFAVWNNAGSAFLKFVVAENVPYTFSMKASVENDVPTVTFTGTAEERFYGKTVAIDWWVSGTVTSYGVIGNDGSWTVKFALTPENGFVLNTMGYAHFSIIESEADPTKLYKLNGTAAQEVNLLSSQMTNKDELADNGDHGEVTGNTFRIANADDSLVYYVGIPNWDAIVLYGVNEKNSLALQSSTPIALKVDDMANATKVYYVFNLIAGGKHPYTADEIKNGFVFGNVDSTTDVFACEKIDDLGDGVYRVWYDITGYTGSQLWPNFYAVSGDAGNPTYTKVLEIRNTNDQADWSGVYAIVGETKYTIKVEYNGPCVVPVALEEGEAKTNPAAADPNEYNKTYKFTDVTLEQADGKVYYSIHGTFDGYAEADVKTLLEAVYFDFEQAGGSYTRYTDLAKVVIVSGKTFELRIDLSTLGFAKHTAHLGSGGSNFSLSDPSIDGRTLTANGKIYTLINDPSATDDVEKCYGTVGIWIQPEETAPSLTVNAVALEADETKVYYVITVTFANDVAESVYADFTFGNGEDVKPLDHKANGTEAKQYKLYFDITDAAIGQLWPHLYYKGAGFDGSSGDIKVNASGSVTLGGKQYTIEMGWDMPTVQVTEAVSAEKSFTPTQVTLEKNGDGTKIYVVIKANVAGYTQGELQATVFIGERDDMTITVETVELQDGVATLKFDFTNATTDGWWWGHYTLSGGSKTDLRVDVTEVTETVGDQTYRLFNQDGMTIIDCEKVQGLEFTNAKLVQENGKVYLVLTATNKANYTQQDLETVVFVGERDDMTVTVESVQVEGTTVTLKFDITDATTNGWWWGHYTINGGDQFNLHSPIEATTLTVGGKSYQLKYNDNSSTQIIVVVSNAG